MKRTARILTGVGCVLLLLISWFTAMTAKSDDDKQLELLKQADQFLEDDAYVSAVSILEEAASYDAKYTMDAEEKLKSAYLQLLNQREYVNRYEDLIERQMERPEAGPDVFLEAGRYYLSSGSLDDALRVLREGASRTGDDEVERLYEENRYGFTLEADSYEYIMPIFGGMAQVRNNGLWGLAAAGGQLMVPCEYERISTYSDGQAVVRKDGTVYMVDPYNNRTRLFHGSASDIGNFSENRTSLLTEDGWILSTGTFAVGNTVFDEVGMFSGGYAPAKMDGKWGVIDAGGVDWLIPAQFEDVIRDELGRCFDQGTFFVKQDGIVYMCTEEGIVPEPYEDARPFNGGWAAVKKDGKWGFVDTSGEIMIDYQFEDALSFSGHLASVKQGGMWGYVSLFGKTVIEPQFMQAKSFVSGSAPVQLEDLSWRFIILKEQLQEAENEI